MNICNNSTNIDLSVYSGDVFNAQKLESLSIQLKEYERARKAFGKANSQWMDINLILSKPTPIRNARQALAHIERSYQAIKETEYKVKKLKIEKQIKERDLENCKDPLKSKLLEIEIEEINYQISSAAYYFEGALKIIQTYIDAYEQICRSKGVEGFDEVDFEEQEEEYHIKTALLQSMRSIRASGRIDPGNQEYLEQCGLDPLVIDRMIQGFFLVQNNCIKDSNNPDLSMNTILAFIDSSYKMLKGSSKKIAGSFGIQNQINHTAAYKDTKPSGKD